MRKLLGSLALGFGLLAGNAHADVDVAKLYIGGGVSSGNVERGDGTDFSVSSISGTVGVQLLDFLGLEFEGGYASDDVNSMIGEPLVDYAALMGRVGYRWDRAGVYGLFGQALLNADEGSGEDRDGVTAWGVGLNLFGNETTALNFHYLDLGGDFTAATIGLQYYFGGFR